MNYPMALFCVGLTFSIAIPASASDMPLPDRNPVVSHAVSDTQSLAQARDLLEQIHYELKKPATRSQEHKGVYAHSSLAAPEAEVAVEPEKIEEAKEKAKELGLEDLSISKPGDLEMMCHDLSKESLDMRDIIYATQDAKDAAKMKRQGLKAAGAIGSFLIGSVTGGVGLAVGGFLLDQNVGAGATEADKLQDVAEQRRTLMMGIYNAKGCQGPLEHAMQNPEIFDPLGTLASIETAAGDFDEPRYNQ